MGTDGAIWSQIDCMIHVEKLEQTFVTPDSRRGHNERCILAVEVDILLVRLWIIHGLIQLFKEPYN